MTETIQPTDDGGHVIVKEAEDMTAFYRFNADSVLVEHWVTPKPKRRPRRPCGGCGGNRNNPLADANYPGGADEVLAQLG